MGEGHFQCPACRRQRDCKLVRVVRYFTLYFIPLCETGNLGEFIQCQGCGLATAGARLICSVGG